MNYYLLQYRVVDDFAARRAPFREEHLRLVREAHERGEVLMGGAVGTPPDGALLIFRAESADVAEAFAGRDPYVIHGLVPSWSVRHWHVVIPSDPSSLSDPSSPFSPSNPFDPSRPSRQK